MLKLELAESTAMTDGNDTIALMHEIRAMGVALSLSLSLSLDDFTTGYASQAYLWHFLLNELKIDRSFAMALLTARTMRPSRTPPLRWHPGWG